MIIKAFKNIFKHPIVLLPDLFLTGFVYLMAQLTWFLTGLTEVFPTMGEVSEEVIRTFFKENAVQIIWPVLLFLLTTFVFGVAEKVIKLELISSIVQKDKPSFLKAWKNRIEYFYRVILLKMYIFLIFFLVFLIIFGVIGFLFYLLINPFTTSAMWISTIITIIFLLLAIVVLKMNFIYIYPILFMTKTRNPYRIIVESFKKFKLNKLFTFKVWLVLFLIGALFGFLSFILSLLQFIVITIIVVLIGVIQQVWADRYIFMKFKEKFLRSH
ncbi:MAG: hypothetical protein ABIJ18_00955 [archaeon]